MALAATEAKTDVFMTSTRIRSLKETPYITRLSMQMQIQDELEHSTTGTSNSSFNQSASTTPTFTPIGLTTIIVSRTATITLTNVALITSESTVTTSLPTEAPLVLAGPTTNVLSPGKIAGIVLGAVGGLLLFVLLFYLLLTRARCVDWLAHYRLEKQEKQHRATKPPARTSTKKPAEKVTPNWDCTRGTGDGRRGNTCPTTIPVAPDPRQHESDRRRRERQAERSKSKKRGNGEHRAGGGRWLA
ncbi:hypothetical protein NUW58_g286 [Xylaria curta]|uniref:Uncharacterized protein n=2 Tax=Xylaria curta TaxID=42375 RepID=A0ACC1PPT7_9PEZI|nr:hypothetical protein NUW58_g2518 [Xylaria curta]KAJ2998566.1 hypothetical protein NUW58_g286 [Xylaria curta]